MPSLTAPTLVPWLRRRQISRRAARLALVLCAGAAVGAATAPAAGAQASWPSGGATVNDSRNQPWEFTINQFNAGQLKPKWVFNTWGDVSSTPTVADGVVYFTDWAGNLYAVNATTGQKLWEMNVFWYDWAPGAAARAAPLVYGNELILGDNVGGYHYTGAQVIAVNRSNGWPIWNTEVDTHPGAVITGDPVEFGGRVFVGVSSLEEGLAGKASYKCCTFRGSVVALDPNTGKVLWKTYTVPPDPSGGPTQPCTSPANGQQGTEGGCDYSGGSVWSDPAVDPYTNTVYVATGNNYTVPDAAVACETQAQANHTSDASCTAPNDYFDSVVALDRTTGQVKWAQKVQGWDAFTTACLLPMPVTWCPAPGSNDWDFGSGPNVLWATGSDGVTRTLVGAGQKSGIYWMFNAQTGAPMWHTLVGPGSSLGGIMWGTATDLMRIYAPEADPSKTPYTLANGQAAAGGSWTAMNPQTGAIEWQTATPGGAAAMAPLTQAGGVLYAASTAPSGNNMFALDASSGNILWSFPAGGSVATSPAIANGNVYWGCGDGRWSVPFGYTSCDKLYDFSLNGQ